MEPDSIAYNEAGTISIVFQAGVYSLLAIKKAAYKFTDRVSVLIQEVEAGNIQVSFNLLNAQEQTAQQQIVQEFCNEVLEQDLRETIAQETEATRSLILAQAFSKTSLLE